MASASAVIVREERMEAAVAVGVPAVEVRDPEFRTT